MQWQTLEGAALQAALVDGEIPAAWDRLYAACPWATVGQSRPGCAALSRHPDALLVLGRGRGDEVMGLALMLRQGDTLLAGLPELGPWAWLSLPIVGDWFWEGALHCLRDQGFRLLRVRSLALKAPRVWLSRARVFGRRARCSDAGTGWVWHLDAGVAKKKIEKRLHKRHTVDLKAVGPVTLVAEEPTEVIAALGLSPREEDALEAYTLRLGERIASRCLVAAAPGQRHVVGWRDADEFAGIAPGLAQAYLLESKWVEEGVRLVTADEGPPWLKHYFEPVDRLNVSVHLRGWAGAWGRVTTRARRAGRKALEMWDPISR